MQGWGEGMQAGILARGLVGRIAEKEMEDKKEW